MTFPLLAIELGDGAACLTSRRGEDVLDRRAGLGRSEAFATHEVAIGLAEFWRAPAETALGDGCTALGARFRAVDDSMKVRLADMLALERPAALAEAFLMHGIVGEVCDIALDEIAALGPEIGIGVFLADALEAARRMFWVRMDRGASAAAAMASALGFAGVSLAAVWAHRRVYEFDGRSTATRSFGPGSHQRASRKRCWSLRRSVTAPFVRAVELDRTAARDGIEGDLHAAALGARMEAQRSSH